MLFMTEYRLKPHLPKSEVKRLMEIFAKRGAADGEIAHYVRSDGTGGYTIGQTEDSVPGIADALAYSEFMTFTTTPILKIEDALGPIAEYLA